MKFSTKLIVSFSVVILLVGGIGLTSSYINEGVKDQVTAESKQAIEEIELSGEMGLQLYRSLTRTQYLLEDEYRKSLSMNFSRGNQTKETLISDIDKSLQKVRESIQEIRKLVKTEPANFFQDTTESKNVIVLLNKFEEKFTIYASLIKQFQDLSTNDYEDGKEFFTTTIEPYFRTTLLPLIEDIRENIQQNHEAEIAGLNSQLDRIGYILLVATFFALVVAISLTFFLYRSMANPIQKVAEAAQNIGQGNLDERIDYKSNDELGQLSEAFDKMAESLSQTTVSRDYVDSIIESMGDLLVVTDVHNNITRVNTAGIAMLNSTEKELVGKPASSIFENNSQIVFGEGAPSDIKSCNAHLLIEPDEKIPVNISKGTIRDRNNDIEGYVVVASDISSEKEAQEKISRSLKEKEVLLAEIHHRVKNNLAVISGLLQMQMWKTENEHAASALKQSESRVRSIALIHEKLYQTESLSYIVFDKYTRDLLQGIEETYRSKDSKIKIVTDLENIVLNINQAIPCSLLINELVVNVFKHAFEDGEEGLIKVTLEQAGDQITLSVRDSGCGFEVGGDTDSLGLTLVETLAKQLKGDIEFTNNGGAEIKVSFEAEEVIAT